MLLLSTIVASSTNPRKHFDQTAQDELATSVKKFGVMQPIIVRPDGDGYELVCGERRYRAALQAGLEEIPAIIRKLSDDEAFDLQITENLQRKDINPMEESDAFIALTKRGKTSAAQIAKRFGKSEKYVYDRLALQRCIAKVQDQVRAGEIPLKHAKQFAQLSIDDQVNLYDVCVKRGELNTSDIQEIIADQFSYVLEQAPFDIKNAKLLPSAGACTKCPKRSGCNQLLFEDVDSKDICFDKSCYDRKVEAHIEQRIKELQEQGMTVHRISMRYMTNLEGVIVRTDWEEVGEDEDGYENCKTLGIVVEARDYGISEDKIGDVIKISIEEEEPETDDEDETDDKNNSKRVLGSSKSLSGVDHDEEVAKHIIDAFADVYGELPLANIEPIVREVFKNNFYRLLDNNAEYLCEKLGWNKVMTEDHEFDHQETAKMLSSELEFVEIRKGISIVSAMDKAEEAINSFGWKTEGQEETEEMIEADEAFENIGMNFYELVRSYEDKTGHKFE